MVRKDLPPAATVMGDQGYDRDKIRKMLAQQGIPPCILPRRCRKKPVHYSKRLDRKGHKIENLFSRQKDWRRSCNPLRPLCPRLLLCHPPGRHRPRLVMSQMLWQRGLHLPTGIRRTMKNSLLPLLDKLLPRKPSTIETPFAKLKSGMGLGHSRHRSPTNAFVPVLSCLAACSLGQIRGNIGMVAIPSLSSPYPELG